ncbi:MAG: hypothetical protein KME30_17010 [Iphinoe sp. HA4291-MV1]|nr:hypothetical protein [Iphinoe sp. HA4291-MV1]
MPVPGTTESAKRFGGCVNLFSAFFAIALDIQDSRYQLLGLVCCTP